MNSIKEIAAQNLQDCWSILYKNLAKEVLFDRGRDGETVVRRANHLCGLKMGGIERDRHAGQGMLVNLKTLFSSPSVWYPDPRFRIKWQLFSEEEAVFDVVTCPLYNKLDETGDRNLMPAFCEEFHHGFIAGYTGGAGQCCLSENFFYPGENSCRIGCYFRSSNIPAELRPGCFSGDYTAETTSPVEIFPGPAPQKAYSLWGKILLESWMEECAKRYGNDAFYILSDGLKAAAHETAGYVLYRSRCTNEKPDESCLCANTFWGAAADDFPDCTDCLKKMIEISYRRILRQDLRL